MKDNFNTAAAVQKPEPGELVFAVDRGDAGAVEDLLRRGADAVAADRLMSNGYGTTAGGLTSLGYAARHGRIDIVQPLLDAGADINFRDKCGFTPLMRAVGNHKAEMVHFLVGRGASLEGKSDRGETIWDIAKGFESMGDILQAAAENRQRAVAAAAVVAAAEAQVAQAGALHDTVASRQEFLKPYARARKLTIKPV